MLQITSKYNVEQTVREQTRSVSYFTWSYRKKTEVHPVISANKVVFTDINTRAKVCKNKPRTVCIYKKAGMGIVRLDINKTRTKTLGKIKPEYNAKDNWTFLKDTIKQAANEHIPQKTASLKVTQMVLRLHWCS